VEGEGPFLLAKAVAETDSSQAHRVAAPYAAGFRSSWMDDFGSTAALQTQDTSWPGAADVDTVLAPGGKGSMGKLTVHIGLRPDPSARC